MIVIIFVIIFLLLVTYILKINNSQENLYHAGGFGKSHIDPDENIDDEYIFLEKTKNIELDMLNYTQDY